MAYRRFLCAFDLHGDAQDNATVAAFLRFDREFKPHDRVCGGDVWDMRPFRSKASTEEKRESVEADFDAGYSFLEEWQPNAFVRGNHDERLWHHASVVNGPISDLARGFVAKVNTLGAKTKCRVYPYHKRDGVHKLGPLRVLHGFYGGDGAAKKMAGVYGPCIFGHIHAADHATLPSIDGRREAWSSPALCRLDMDYNAGTPSTLRYSSGWIYGVYSERDYHVCVAEVRDGRVLVATDLREFRA
jgi:hypothetical protein